MFTFSLLSLGRFNERSKTNTILTKAREKIGKLTLEIIGKLLKNINHKLKSIDEKLTMHDWRMYKHLLKLQNFLPEVHFTVET